VNATLLLDPCSSRGGVYLAASELHFGCGEKRTGCSGLTRHTRRMPRSVMARQGDAKSRDVAAAAVVGRARAVRLCVCRRGANCIDVGRHGEDVHRRPCQRGPLERVCRERPSDKRLLHPEATSNKSPARHASRQRAVCVVANSRHSFVNGRRSNCASQPAVGLRLRSQPYSIQPGTVTTQSARRYPHPARVVPSLGSCLARRARVSTLDRQGRPYMHIPSLTS
jgi:hypothetical protein